VPLLFSDSSSHRQKKMDVEKKKPIFWKGKVL